MATAAANAHITAQQRLRQLTARGVAAGWTALPRYDEDQVDPFLRLVVPLVLAAQRQAVALTEGFLALVLGRRPLGVAPERLIGSAARAGADPAEVYRRPFVTVWSDLSAGRDWEDAVANGLSRATSTAETDVQLAMRETLRAVGEADELILGYQRVPDADACDFCKLVAGQRYTTDQLMPIHNRCGCGVDVITAANRGDFTGKRENDLSVTRDGVTADVREHGELGPVVVDGAHHFTDLGEIEQRLRAGGSGSGRGGGSSLPPAPPGGEPEEVDGETFHRAFSVMKNHPRAAWLTEYTSEEFDQMRCFLSHGGGVGGAVRTADDGVLEAVSIFNATGPKGAGLDMAKHLVSQGATRLDCIGPDLRDIYELIGFVVTEEIPWDDAFAPPNWDYEADGRPPIYVMELQR